MSEKQRIRQWVVSRYPDIEPLLDASGGWLLNRAYERWAAGSSMGEVIMGVHRDIATLKGEPYTGQEYRLGAGDE